MSITERYFSDISDIFFFIYKMDERWGITDWDSADETLEWIRDKGHRSDFARIPGIIKGLNLLGKLQRQIERLLLAVIAGNVIIPQKIHGTAAVPACNGVNSCLKQGSH